MRKIFLTVASLILMSGIFVARSYAEQAATTLQQNSVDVYYFYGNFRCPTCFRIEQYSREAVESSFKDELASGKITFKAVNTDEQGNGHFVNDYQLYTKSLVISLKKDSKEIKYKNLTKVWDYIMDKKQFFDYVKNEVANYLKEQ